MTTNGPIHSRIMMGGFDVAEKLSEWAASRFDEATNEFVAEFIDVGEPRLAVETVLGCAVERRLTVPAALVSAAAEIYLSGRHDPDSVEIIRTSVAALTATAG